MAPSRRDGVSTGAAAAEGHPATPPASAPRRAAAGAVLAPVPAKTRNGSAPTPPNPLLAPVEAVGSAPAGGALRPTSYRRRRRRRHSGHPTTSKAWVVGLALLSIMPASFGNPLRVPRRSLCAVLCAFTSPPRVFGAPAFPWRSSCRPRCHEASRRSSPPPFIAAGLLTHAQAKPARQPLATPRCRRRCRRPSARPGRRRRIRV